MRYCPRHLLLTSLMQHYAWFFWFHDPRARKVKTVLKRLLGRKTGMRNEHGFAK
jgi:hypothetical protein